MEIKIDRSLINSSEEMDHRIFKIKKFRQHILHQISDLSTEQLNEIPNGLHNNIIWNVAHLISAQQGICYLRGGQTPIVPDSYILPFSTNTKPDRFIEKVEIDQILELFMHTIEVFQEDYEKKIFHDYVASPNILRVYGIELKDIEEGIDFLLFHEGYHSAYISTLIKLIH